MTVTFNTSRIRFDEWKQYTGLYQRMGTVAVDADWNEEVQLRATDARRRTGDLAEGSPDDGFRITGDFLLDPIRSIVGWATTGLAPGDERRPVPELRLDRHDPESLPWVLRSRWHTALRRTLPAAINLTAIPRQSSTPFAASALVFELRLERPAADDEIVDIRVLIGDADGAEASVSASGFGLSMKGWATIVVPVTQFTGVDLSKVTVWGVRGLPPLARAWVGGLRAVDAALGDDVCIRGGDGTLPGAGRIFVGGHRAFIPRDLRYSAQPDFPQAPALPALPADGSLQHVFYLDVWEQTVTALDDPSLLEPALDGVDTTARLRTIAQVRALPSLASGAAFTLPTPTGGGTLTTNIAANAMPDRSPPPPIDPCRDRCLFTENASTGEGYIGSDNLHVRVQVMRVGALDVALWSRDNGATVMALTRSAAADATSLRVAPADAVRLRAGDIIVVEDRATRLRWDAPTAPVLRRLRGVQADTGILELDEAGATLTTNPSPLPCGGPLGRAFSISDGATVRRWDGADLLVTGVRYRLEDGITFAFAGTGWRSGDYWTFTARVNAPDGAARGVVDQLTASPAHGPIHAYTPLARATGSPRVLEDLRPRYLPLTQVRDRLKELGDKKYGPGVFVVVVGDGVRTFGDVDQALDEGLTGDEALQAALDLLGADGGSIFIRAGRYQLEHPVLVRSLSSVRIIGDGDATVLDVRGAGGAFYVDRCGGGGVVALEDLVMHEDPDAEVDIGEPGDDLDVPSVRVRGLFDRLLEKRFSPVAMPAERTLNLDDIRVDGGVPDFIDRVGARIKMLPPGEGRVAGSVVATLIELRRIQRLRPDDELEDIAEAQPLLGALSAMPHGVLTIADSRQVSVRRCLIVSRRPAATGVGVLVTGTCADVEIENNRIEAATGIAALPYAPYLSNTALVGFPRAGLDLSGLQIAGNIVRGAGIATTGVHVADGRLSGTEIDGNLITGFVVGILVADQAEAGREAAVDRIAVRANRIVGATAIGVQIDGDGADVMGNEIQNAAGTGAFQAGVQVSGHSTRIVDCWIELPSAPALPPVALLAGVVVGDGIDDGVTPARAVYDVEVNGNRIEGSGSDTAAIGIVVGGPQAIYDVRVRENVVRNLGDAALRTWSSSGPVGRLHVEDNRIERVALGGISDQLAETSILDRLQPGVVASLPANATRTPRALLNALASTSLPQVRAPLDAALRWVERLSLRGALVIAGIDGGTVRGNQIAETGTDDDLPEGDIGRSDIRTAAIAVVAAAEVVIDDNEIEAVRAPYNDLENPGGGDADQRPEMLDVLTNLGFGAATTRINRSDVHLALVDLRARVLEYAAGAADVRGRLGRALYGPLDATIGELAQLGGNAAAFAENLSREAGALRSAQTFEHHTVTANEVRGTLSQAASATAPDGIAQDAWDAAAQLDLATQKGGTVVRDTAQRLLDRSDSLVAGLATSFETALETALRTVVEQPTVLANQLAAATILGRIATVRDQQARKKDLPITAELAGTRRTIVSTFADAAVRHLDAISGATTGNGDRIEELRKAKDALVDQLKDVHGGLAADVAADFRDVSRTGGVIAPAITRLRTTLGKVTQLAAGNLGEMRLDENDGARASSQARGATIDLYARSIDRQIGGLVSESDESLEKALASFGNTMTQLAELTNGQPDLDPLAHQAAAAVRTAVADPARRRVQLSTARTILERIRGNLIDVLPSPILPETTPVEPVERRLAALTSLVLELDGATSAVISQAMPAFGNHLDQVLSIIGADSGERQRAHTIVDEAAKNLAGAPGPVRSRAAHALVGALDNAVLKAVGGGSEQMQLEACSALVHAVLLAIDPADDAATRLTKARTHLAGRTTKVAASLVAQAQQLDLSGLIALLHDALARIARGRDHTTIDTRPPQILVAPSPADGIFIAGVDRRARISHNRITEAVSGIVVAGSAGHLVTEPPDDGMALEVGDNRIAGCAAVGASIRPEGTGNAVIWDNQISGCSGIAVTTGDPWGQAVMVISGAGDLVVRGNVLHENGNTGLRAQLHELVVDWRGPAGIRSNTIRHSGGGAGGAGLVVITETIPATLIGNLSQTTFLGVEPAPAAIKPGTLSLRGDVLLSAREIAPLAPLTQAEDVVEVGGLRQRFATVPILQKRSTLPRIAEPAPRVATAFASRYLDRSRTFVANPIVDFLVRPPIIFVPPPVRRAYDSVHVEGNDVDAMGPALLLLSDGGTLIATSVIGNELRSRGRAGAVYVRRTDSTLFTGNRVECLDVVTVAVLRVGKAPVTATGNVLVGAEPVHQVSIPPAVTKAPAGGVSLSIGTGKGSLQVPVDARKLLGSLDRRKNLASDTFAELLADIATTPAPSPAPPPAPAAAPAAPAAPAAGAPEAPVERLAVTHEAALARTETPMVSMLTPTLTLRTRNLLLSRSTPILSSELLHPDVKEDLAKIVPQGVEPVVAARTVYGRAGSETLDNTTALRKLVDTVTLHEEDPAAAKIKIGAALAAGAGDPKKALQIVDENVLGLGSAKPTVREAVANVSVIHEVLGAVLAADPGPEVALAPVPRPPPAPNPSDHTLVIIGGTRVAAVGNAATAGVHVQDADATVQLNP